MSHPVVIENDRIRMEVWPALGGKISSILDKSDRFELLFNYPAELPTSPQYDQPYADGWHAGWDECFPAIGRGPYVGHPYDGIEVPDHGELWGVATTTAVPTKDGITVVWHGLRFGYRLTRKLYLDGAGVVAEYTLVNLAPYDFRFIWAAHALLPLGRDVEIAFDGHPAFAVSPLLRAGETQRMVWPRGPGMEDFSRPDGLPPRRGWRLFSADPIGGPATIHFRSRGRGVQVAYASDDDLPAYWGVWINTGAWLGHHHFAIEPTTGRHETLDVSVRDGSAGLVGPAGKRSWTVRWSLL